MTGRVRPTGGNAPSKRPSVEASKRKSRGFGAKLPARLKWALWLVGGIAVTAAAGYLVAALVFFPAPMRASEREVVDVTGMSQAEAGQNLRQSGLTDSVAGHEPHPDAREGNVIWQDPPAGVAVPRGSVVTLVLSSGAPTVLVPDVEGYDADIATRILAAAGLRVDGIDSVDAKDVPSGMTAGTNPAVGERLAIGRSIMLHLAR